MPMKCFSYTALRLFLCLCVCFIYCPISVSTTLDQVKNFKPPSTTTTTPHKMHSTILWFSSTGLKFIQKEGEKLKLSSSVILLLGNPPHDNYPDYFPLVECVLLLLWELYGLYWYLYKHIWYFMWQCWWQSIFSMAYNTIICSNRSKIHSLHGSH